MKNVLSASLLLLLFPIITNAQSLQTFLTNLVSFLDGIVIPFLATIAFLFFTINTIRFFVIGGSNEEGREKAKALAIYGVAAFVLIIIFWGIIDLITSSIGFNTTAPVSDYVSGT